MLKIFSYIITFLTGILVGKSLKRKRVKIKYFDATSKEIKELERKLDRYRKKYLELKVKELRGKENV